MVRQKCSGIRRSYLTLALRKVNVIRYSSEDVFIADGLKPGDKVVIAGVSKLRPGEKVSLEDKF
ncbi:hypothetical protein [Serratia nevei]|uniref:hypothetical protein n=1 Tax=Serratia nevei TaxID=2703794 RepID=UPI00399A17CB